MYCLPVAIFEAIYLIIFIILDLTDLYCYFWPTVYIGVQYTLNIFLILIALYLLLYMYLYVCICRYLHIVPSIKYVVLRS
jgi:hypothetical protein